MAGRWRIPSAEMLLVALDTSLAAIGVFVAFGLAPGNSARWVSGVEDVCGERETGEQGKEANHLWHGRQDWGRWRMSSHT